MLSFSVCNDISIEFKMFIKPFRVKSNSQMKGSDKKKFKARIVAQFMLPECDRNTLDCLVPAKEDASLTKIYTYSGESVIVYLVGKDPIFFEIDKQKILFPTVYALWKCPNLLGKKVITTVSGVVPKITNGADLMLPGVVADVENRGMKAYCDGELKKGDVIYINLIENKAAVAVGTATQSSEDLYMQGMRGKAVNILHTVGDQLWNMGNRVEAPNLGPIEGTQWLDNETKINSDPDNMPCDNTEQTSVNPAVGEENSRNQNKNIITACSNDQPDLPSIENAVENLLLGKPCIKTEETANMQEIEEEIEEPDSLEKPESPIIDFDVDKKQDVKLSEELDNINTEGIMNKLIENAFLQALKTTAKKLELPLLTSTFFRQHMLPACPTEIGGPIDLKKSSYKKLNKFLLKMIEEEIITVKEQKKGVEVITEVNYNHDKILSYRPVKLESTGEAKKMENGGAESYAPPIVTELYLVTAEVSKFFAKFSIRKGDGLTATEIREYVRQYVSQESLQHPTDPSIINLDPILADAVLVKGENLIVTFRWDKLTSRITSKMSKGYSMEFKCGNKSRMIVQKGKLETIEMMLGTRSGNKKVTLIHNLDVFGIDLHEFAHKCQVGVAASTAINEAHNKKRAGGHPVMEVLIQGNQVAFASKLLIEEYKLPRKYIRGTELAAKKKGGATKK